MYVSNYISQWWGYINLCLSAHFMAGYSCKNIASPTNVATYFYNIIESPKMTDCLVSVFLGLIWNSKVCHFIVLYYSQKTDLLKMQIIDVFFRTTITQIILEFFWKDQNDDLKKIQILMEGFSFWIKIEGVRLELKEENSIYRSRKTVCLFTINCDCIGLRVNIWIIR